MTWTPRVIHNPNYGVVTEKTDQGQQIVLPGTERSALQAAKERGEKMRPKKPQADRDRYSIRARSGHQIYSENRSDLDTVAPTELFRPFFRFGVS